ncbi:MAG: hypothetical protein RL325_1791, partial [Planctomycetota bacterium]
MNFGTSHRMNPRTRRRILLSSVVAGSLAAAVAGGLTARAWFRGNQIEEKRSQGLSLFARGAFAEALEPLAFAARRNDDTEVVLALAECRMKVPEANGRHLQTAAAYFRSVQAREPSNVRALRGQLEACIGLGHLPEIPPLVRQLLAAAPGDVRAHEIELEVLNLTGRFSEAAAKARELQKLEPSNGRWRAAELVGLERSGADAEGRLARVREWSKDGADARDPALRLLESDLLRETGRIEESRRALRALVEEGVADRKQLEALIAAVEAGGFDAAERDRLVEGSLARSRTALANPEDAIAVEGERLLRAGRLGEIAERFRGADATDPTVFRLLFSAAYLGGRDADARSLAEAFLQKNGARDPFGVAARAALSDEPAHARIEAVAGTGRVCPKDPVVAVILADIMLGAGEFDEAQSILVRAFEESGESFQPLGVRAVRASVSLGRVRDAFRIAEELLVRYGSSGDGTVALLAVEAWAAVLEANYQPTTRGGVYGTDSPEALRRFWTALGGPDAKRGPASLAPAVADVFLARGDRETAREILAGALADGQGDGASLDAARLARALRSASAIDPALQTTMVGETAGASSADLAIVIAERLASQGDARGALGAIESGLAKADASQRVRLERLRRPLVDPTGLEAWLADELAQRPGLETAVFVLARPEPWNAKDDSLVRAAIGQMKQALGAESLRVLVAEAAMTIAYHSDDAQRVALSIASLDAAATRSPDSASVLTTLAALFERQDPPLFDRSSRLLARAVEVEPGSVSTYPQLVNALQQIGDFDGAEQALEAYIRVVGEDLQSRRNVADFKARQGQLAEAARIREQLVGRSKEVVDAIALARIRQRLGETESAERILLDLRGALRAEAKVGGADAARELLVEREMALLLAREGRIEDARASLDAAKARLAGPRLDEVRANVELAYGDATAALALARALVRTVPSGVHELLLARALLRTGDAASAREALVRSLAADPDNPDATSIAAALLIGDPSGREMLETSLAASSKSRPDLTASIAILDRITTPEGRLAVNDAALADALALTTQFSGSPLAWRVAVQLHLIAERRDDAFRLAQRALTRLPSDATIGKLATETAIAVGRIDEAATAALVWRKMSTAEAEEVDVARAMIELLQRHPEHGFEILHPIAREILTRSTEAGAVRTLVGCAVFAGRIDAIRGDLAVVPRERRGEIVGAWLEASQSLPAEKAIEAVDEAAQFAGDDPIGRAACIAAWTGLCQAGLPSACEKAAGALASFKDAEVPTMLLAADLAAARGELDAAIALYRSGFDPVLAPFEAASPDDPRLLAALRQAPTAVVCLNNAAEALLRAQVRGADALRWSRIACAALPSSPLIVDTHARALAASGDFSAARALAERNSDAILSMVCLAEIELARGDRSEARRALGRADARLAVSFAPTRAIADRMQRVRLAVEEA